MTGEAIPAEALKPGDVIHIKLHEHDTGGKCLICQRESDVEVLSVTAPLGDDLVVIGWCQCRRFCGASDTVTGAVVYAHDRPVLCIRHASAGAAA
jgi:hypothetical protein